MAQRRGEKGTGNVNPIDEKKGEKGSGNNGSGQQIRCVYCGEWYEPVDPIKQTLPKHKLPLKNGKDPDKVGYCVGEGKKGLTKEEIRKMRIKATRQRREEEKSIQHQI